MASRGRPKRSKDIDFDCLHCGKHCSVPEWNNAKKKFCSKTCFHRYRVGRPQDWLKIKPDEKICPQCGGTFLCGGKGRPPRYQLHCSRTCNVAAQGYRTEAKPLSPAEAAYIAGFIDGEGCISFYRRQHSVNVKLIACNCKRAALDWIAETTGIGSVTKHTKGSAKHAASYYWQLNTKAAGDLLRHIRPYLKIKGDQADLAIEAYRLHENKTFADSPEVRERFLNEIRALNKRGPS